MNTIQTLKYVFARLTWNHKWDYQQPDETVRVCKVCGASEQYAGCDPVMGGQEWDLIADGDKTLHYAPTLAI